MKLFLTAGLQLSHSLFRWLIEEAPNFDLVCIGGDFLDLFKFETRIEQSREIRKLIRETADIVPVAICSGSRDNAATVIEEHHEMLVRLAKR